MITPEQALEKLNSFLTARKEIYYLQSVEPSTNGQVTHNVWFFTIRNDRLYNVSPLISALIGFPVSDTQKLQVKGQPDWLAQVVAGITQKYPAEQLTFKSWDDAEPVVALSFTVPVEPLNLIAFGDGIGGPVQGPTAEPQP